MTDFDALKHQFDCRQEVSKVLGDPRVRTAKAWQYRCPMHDDSTPSFTVYVDGWKCFGCGAQGDVFDWWAWASKRPLADVLREHNVNPERMAEISLENARRAEAELQASMERAQRALEELRGARKWLEYHQNLDNDPNARQQWRAWGIPDEWQDLWDLGSCPDFPLFYDKEEWHTPTMTIPIKAIGGEVMNIRHRLMNPKQPGDKYRPERSGLRALPFICDTDLKEPERIIVVEGEKKAAVTYITLDDPKTQIYGLPGKEFWQKMVELLKGYKPIFIMDPGAESESYKAAKATGGRFLRLPEKIDDMIVANDLTKNWLEGALKCARAV